MTRLKALGVPLMVLVIVPPGGGIPGGPLLDVPGTLHVLEIGKIAEELRQLK